jgi:hypothetical protein
MDDLTTIQNGRRTREDKRERKHNLSSVLEEIEQAMEEMEDFKMIDSTLNIDEPKNDDEAAYAHLYRAWLLLSNQL